MSRNFLQVFEAKNYDTDGLENPLFRRRSRSSRRKIKLAVVAGIVAIAIGFLLWCVFGSWLRYTQVELSGITTLDETRVRDTINEQLERRLLVFPRNHRWFFAEKPLREALLTTYALQSIHFERYGNTLRVALVEDVTVIAFRSADVIAFLDRQGKITRIADPLEVVTIRTRLGEVTPQPDELAALPVLPDPLPIIRAARSVTLEVGNGLFSADIMQQTIKLHEALQARHINVKEYVVEEIDVPWFRVISDLPYEIYVDVAHDIQTQLARLEVVMEDYEAEPPRHYIDVRFGDRVFVR